MAPSTGYGYSLLLLLYGILCSLADDSAAPVPPLIALEPEDEVAFALSHSIRLPCAASGYPSPTYQWTKDGVTIVPDGSRLIVGDEEGSLEITSTVAEDEGVYQCWAENTGGRVRSNTVQLRVAYIDLPQYLTTPKPTIDVEYKTNPGMHFTFECGEVHSYPLATITWATVTEEDTMDNIIMDKRVVMDMAGNLHLTNVKEGDSNTYVCMASNTVVRNILETTKIKFVVDTDAEEELTESALIWSSPKDITFKGGDSLELQCIFSGNPTPMVRWVRPEQGSELPQGRWHTENAGTLLVIADLQPEDAGLYECVGYNNATSTSPASSSFTVNVHGAPPTFISRPESVNATEASSVTFSCRTRGDPEPEVVWSINGIPLKKAAQSRVWQSGSDLVVDPVMANDTMVVDCGSHNQHGMVNASAYLRVVPEEPDMSGDAAPESLSYSYLLLLAVACLILL